MPSWGVYLGGAVLLSLVGFGAGWQVRTWKAESKELKVLQQGIAQGKKDQKLADYEAGLYEEQRYEAQAASEQRSTDIRTIYRTERIEVPAKCEPPAGALRLLDNAIGAANAQVAGEPSPEVPTDTGETSPVRRP